MNNQFPCSQPCLLHNVPAKLRAISIIGEEVAQNDGALAWQGEQVPSPALHEQQGSPEEGCQINNRRNWFAGNLLVSHTLYCRLSRKLFIEISTHPCTCNLSYPS